MALVSFQGKDQDIPTDHEAFSLSDTAELPADTMAVRVAVATAGNLVFESRSDVEITYHYPAVGVYVERGSFLRVKSTGATAVLSPASTVVALRIAHP